MQNRREITVNGKSLAQIAKELSERFSEAEPTRDGYMSIPIWAFEERLNSVVGIMNYNVLCTEGKLYNVNGQDAIFVNMTLEIYSDNGEIILKKSACGGANVIIVKETQKPKSLKSDQEIAVSDAFKNCCKKLGMGIEQMREYSQSRKKKGGPSYNSQGSGDAGEKGKLHHVRFMTGVDTNRGRFTAQVTDLDDGKQYSLVIFEREVPLIEEHVKMADFIRYYTPGKTFSFFGEVNNYKGMDQLIFRRPSLKNQPLSTSAIV